MENNINIIAAEIEPVSNQANHAAVALQKIGFRILHIGPTISVQGPMPLWESTFNVSFEKQKSTKLTKIKGGDVVYYKALTENMQIPTSLQTLISNMAFIEPPEFY